MNELTEDVRGYQYTIARIECAGCDQDFEEPNVTRGHLAGLARDAGWQRIDGLWHCPDCRPDE